MSDDAVAMINESLARYSAGELDAVDALFAGEFFTYVPTPAEPSATEIHRAYAAELKVAAPDLQLRLVNARAVAGLVEGEVVMSGTWTGPLWGVPGSGDHYEFRIPVRARPVGDRFAFEVLADTPALLGILRELGLVNPPDQMHLPPPHPTVFDDFLVKLLFTGQVADKPCAHLADVRFVETDAERCEDCGPDEIWPALRLCLICGHVGCCDTSTNKHAKSHWEQTGHALIRSIRLSEAWIWCYEDNAVFQRRTLDRLAAALAEGS